MAVTALGALEQAYGVWSYPGPHGGSILSRQALVRAARMVIAMGGIAVSSQERRRRVEIMLEIAGDIEARGGLRLATRGVH